MSDIPCRASPLDRLKSLLLYPLPHHAISRVVLGLTRWRWRPWKNGLIRLFVRVFRVDLGEAAEPDVRVHPHFNAFFTRALAPGARPLPEDERVVVSPADGTVSCLGTITRNRLIQAKGQDYRVTELLGDETLATPFHNGAFATVYLSPRDYHRVHMPWGGRLRHMAHVPGRLFSVAPHTVRAVPRLFARNERVVTLFDTDRGPMAVVLVGAICVASIEVVWHGVVTPPTRRTVRHWPYGEEASWYDRGAEIARFNMGSTAIVLFGEGVVDWRAELGAGSTIRMGEGLGAVHA